MGSHDDECHRISSSFLIPQTRKRLTTLNLGCLLIIIGVWIEKGPGFVIPGFVPDPLGEIYVYVPNLLELMVSFGIWAIGSPHLHPSDESGHPY